MNILHLTNLLQTNMARQNISSTAL